MHTEPSIIYASRKSLFIWFLVCLGITAVAIWLISLDPNELPPATNPEEEFDPRSPASFIGLGVMVLFSLKLLFDLLRDKKRIEFNTQGVFVHYAKRPFLVPWSEITGLSIMTDGDSRQESLVIKMQQPHKYLRNFSGLQHIAAKQHCQNLETCITYPLLTLKLSAGQIEERFNLHFESYKRAVPNSNPAQSFV